MITKNHKFTKALIVLPLIVGCAASSSTETKTTEMASEVVKMETAKSSAHIAESVVQNITDKTSYQKPGASVTYAYNLKSQLSAGETITFKLTLDEFYDQGQLTVSLNAEGGIALLAPTQARFDMSTGPEHEMDISLTANGNGRHYINVQAIATDGAGMSQPRIFSIPVQVGAPTAKKPSANMKTLENGQNVIEMEAQEEIIVK